MILGFYFLIGKAQNITQHLANKAKLSALEPTAVRQSVALTVIAASQKGNTGPEIILILIGFGDLGVPFKTGN